MAGHRAVIARRLRLSIEAELSTSPPVTIVGAGIVGISCGLELQRRGFEVTLLDRREPGSETSSGNAGILSYSNVTPLAAPEILRRSLRLLLNQETDFRLHYPHLLSLMPWMMRFIARCRRAIYLHDGHAMSDLTLPSIDLHRRWIAEAGVEQLVNAGVGGLKLYRNQQTFARDALERELLADCGIRHTVMSADEAYELEPSLQKVFTRAVLVEDSISIRNPQKLCRAYADLFRQAGGKFRIAQVRRIRPANAPVTGNASWTLTTEQGEETTERLLLCLGAWTPRLLTPLGYRNPLAIERGYHTVFAPQQGHSLSRPIFDCDASYVMAPMEMGLRVSTGTNLVRGEVRPDPVQLDQVIPRVREAFPVAEIVLEQPWMGRRPTVPDTLPLIGPSVKPICE